ncbi:MAG TPA: anthranilate phosphoribosyltransferase [Acidimicrobiales bacterium]|nr:anthranilate phosphoribosyltransferase [Acidimicrobiales bacterium]
MGLKDPPGPGGAAAAGEDGAFSGVGGWPAVLRRLMRREALGADLAALALGEILDGNATPAQTAAFIVGMRMKGETVEEMTGLVSAMLDHSVPVVVPGELVDTCGTGGDGSRSINISTIAALVVAGAGPTVCKHGGRAASSSAGSADVLQALGVVIDLGPDGVARCLEEAGIGFCFAPRFHPAMRHAAPVRAELGVPTLFNFLGPMANPARARHQVLGVSDPAMAEKMIGVLEARGSRRALVVYGHDGLDELTTTTTSTVLQYDRLGRRRYEVDPAALGLRPARPEDLRGADAATNAALARSVLEGEGGARLDVVLLNAAAGLVAAGTAADLTEGLGQAEASVTSGAAAAALERLVEVSQEAAADGMR